MKSKQLISTALVVFGLGLSSLLVAQEPGAGPASGEKELTETEKAEGEAIKKAMLDSMTGAGGMTYPSEFKAKDPYAYDYDQDGSASSDTPEDGVAKTLPAATAEATIETPMETSAETPTAVTPANVKAEEPAAAMENTEPSPKLEAIPEVKTPESPVIKAAPESPPQPVVEAGSQEQGKLGANKNSTPFVITEVNDDEFHLEHDAGKNAGPSDGTLGHKPLYFRGRIIEDDSRKQEKVVYQYVSRGAWLITRIQPFFDRLAVEVIRADRSEIVSGFTELARTYVYLCSLIASDDGSKAYEKKAAEAVSLHREALGQLRMRWNGKSPELVQVFDQYLKLTFFRDLNRDMIKIRAGELVKSRYETLSEKNSELKDTLTEREVSGGSAIPNPFGLKK